MSHSVALRLVLHGGYSPVCHFVRINRLYVQKSENLGEEIKGTWGGANVTKHADKTRRGRS